MKIVIDARFWGPKHTGLGIYTQKLVENLAKIDHQNDYTLLVRQKVDSPFKQKIVDEVQKKFGITIEQEPELLGDK